MSATGRPSDDELRQRIADAWAVDLGDTPIRADVPSTDAAWLALAERLALVIENAGHRVQPLPRAVPHPPLPPRPHLPDRAEPSPVEALAALMSWAEQRGIEVRAVDVRLGEDGHRHVVSRGHTAADQELLVVPRAALIVEDDVHDTAVGLALAKAAPPLDSGHTPLALWLASERREPSSRWRPYLEALPPVVDLPWFWADPEVLAELRGTHVEMTLDLIRGSVLADHAALVERLPRLEVTLGELAWGRAIASSRVFRVSVGGIERLAMAPVADLFDHGPADASWRYDDKRAAFVVTAKRALAPGEPIHLSYGKKPLARYVTGYGFTPAPAVDAIAAAAGATDDEPDKDDPRLDDVAGLLFEGLLDDPRAALAVHLIWRHELERPLIVTASATWDDHAKRALSIARLLAADSRELIHAVDRGRFIRHELAWLGPRNEKAALARIADAARAAQARITSSAEADRALLADAAVTGWRRTAAALREAERAVLERWAELASVAAPLHHEKSPWTWRKAADVRHANGHRHPLAVGYLRAVADELPA